MVARGDAAETLRTGSPGSRRVLDDQRDETVPMIRLQLFSLPQLDDGRSGSTLILRRRPKPRDVWMIRQQFSNRFTQRARAVAVDYAHFAEAVQEGFVEKLVGEVDGLVGFLSD